MTLPETVGCFDLRYPSLIAGDGHDPYVTLGSTAICYRISASRGVLRLTRVTGNVRNALGGRTIVQREVRRILCAAVLVLGSVACAAPIPTPAPPTLQSLAGPITIRNGTTIPVTVAVNGAVIASEPAGGIAKIATGAVSAPPWTIEARSPSGRVLASLLVGVDDLISDQQSIGDVEYLECGELVMWVGGPTPDAPRPSAASPQPCD
jgi:hypothetical protein